MDVSLRYQSNIIPEDIVTKIYNHVADSLTSITTVGDDFIVNPTVWLSSKENPRVTNSAHYISSAFQNNIRDEYNWTKEPKIIGQNFDAARTFTIHNESYFLDESNFRKLHQEYWRDNEGNINISKFTRRVEDLYLNRNHYEIAQWVDNYEEYFSLSPDAEPIDFRVGLEFEIGNIASSFRSINKLGILFKENKIDIGVFVATSKEAATSIWPPENRNGSFEELEERNYRDNISYPIVEIKFEPDGYSRDAPYLGRSGDTYEMSHKGEDYIDGTKYVVYEGDGSEYYREK